MIAQKAEVKFDPAYLMPSQIATKIEELGYPATVIEGDASGQGTIELRVCKEYVLKCFSPLPYVFQLNFYVT